MLKVWNVHTGSERLTLRGHTESVSGCAFSPDGTLITSVSNDCTLKVWDAQTGVCLTTFPTNGKLRACTVYQDSRHIIAAGNTGLYFLKLVQ
jgi:WD40 repeat protein